MSMALSRIGFFQRISWEGGGSSNHGGNGDGAARYLAEKGENKKC
ncbi:hypothetical protein [Entomobacter blattae]|nr:hypothetical protein [Entomobacter blattae]